MTKKGLYIIIPNLKVGGSERVISNIIKYIDKNKFVITLILCNKIGKFVNDIPSEINIIDLKKARVRHSIIPIVRILLKNKPDLVLSTLGHLNLLIALFIPILPKRTKFIARESNTISIRNKDESYPKLFDFLFKTVYKNFDLVICQAHSMKRDLKNNFAFPTDKMVVINNPIDFQNIYTFSKKKNEHFLPKNKINLLIVGRLSYQKRVDHAIILMSLLPDNFHLTVAGEGELKKELNLLVTKLKLNKKVSLIGSIHNPYNLYDNADYLLSTSRYEGFPNVVLEANSCGIPVIAYNYTGGIDEIIVDKVNGQLVEDGNIKELSNVIIETVKSNNYNSDTIKKMTKKKYAAEIIVRQYEEEFIKFTTKNIKN